MSFDGMFTYAITEELKNSLENGRISKVHQPYKNELIFVIRSNGANHKLLLSAHPSYARIHLTEESYENPSEPPMFCMLMRKHLEGGVIEEIGQIGMERILYIDVKGRSEIGDVTYKRVIIEVMGRHSNIILIDRGRNMILDSIKHLSPAVNRHRTVMPGQEYVLPPEQMKANPFEATEETVLRKLDFNAGKLDQQIMQQFSGISPLFAREILFRAGLANRSSLPQSFLSLVGEIKQHHLSPAMIELPDKDYFYILPLTHLEGRQKPFSTISEMLDRYYYGKAARDRVKQQGNDLERFVQNEIKKNKTKIKKLEGTLKDAEKAEKYKLQGELITANMYAIKRGDASADVINYYNGDTVTITLNPQKTPSDNAQAYFQKYNKAKKSVAYVKEQISLAEKEIAYFENLFQQIESASPKDIEEIREELMEGGYLKKKQTKGNKKAKQAKIVLEAYRSSDGTDILVGKNNKQNDHLTNKTAARDDIWLHTKDIPGSHVVIRHPEPSDETILEAANLAAYFSKAKGSSSVPVDFTKVRHVKKPNGSKPGFVIYDNQQTVYVTPDPDLVIKLKM